MEEVKKTGLTFIDTRRLANISYKDIKNGFVGFGYYLKIIRDEKLWQGQGYDSFNEFLGDEYGKDKSWASRCINLYDKFGIPVEPGELPRLEDAYESYNVSQLIEMIPMQEELQEQVTPDMSVKAIRALKPKKRKKLRPSQPRSKNQSPARKPSRNQSRNNPTQRSQGSASTGQNLTAPWRRPISSSREPGRTAAGCAAGNASGAVTVSWNVIVRSGARSIWKPQRKSRIVLRWMPRMCNREKQPSLPRRNVFWTSISITCPSRVRRPPMTGT